MNGARKYSKLFKTGQYGKLYIVSGRHARGSTFHIWVLPDKEEGLSNGTNNGPLNNNKVEVYGITGGNPGWTESYGWLHQGKWQEDFYDLVEKAASDKIALQVAKDLELAEKIAQGADRISDLLSNY